MRKIMSKEFTKLCDTISDILDKLIEKNDIIEQTHRKCTVSFFIEHLQKANVFKDEFKDLYLAGITHWDVTSPEGEKLIEVTRDGTVLWQNPKLAPEEVGKFISRAKLLGQQEN